jgi:hypothetical protein
MTVLSVLDAAGRRRSLATLPGYLRRPPTPRARRAGAPAQRRLGLRGTGHASRPLGPAAQQGQALPGRPAYRRRSWRSCATRPRIVTAGGCER